MTEMLVEWKKSGRTTPLPPNQISVTKNGLIQISRKFEHDHFNGKAIAPFFDAENKIVALKPTVDPDKGYKFRRQGKTTRCGGICVRKLILTLNIKPQRYFAEWSEEKEMLIFAYATEEGKP